MMDWQFTTLGKVGYTHTGLKHLQYFEHGIASQRPFITIAHNQDTRST